MTQPEVMGHIQRILGDLATAKGSRMPLVSPSTRLLGGDLPIDSLDLATLIVELEEVTGTDPFRAGLVDFRTVGELCQLYGR
jgi:acyl carrier protein